MSHKRWVNIMDMKTLEWKTEGFPFDQGLEDLTGELFVGPFLTRRAAEWMTGIGFPTGTLSEMEAAAKKSPAEIKADTVENLLPLPKMDEELSELIHSSYINRFAEHMVH